MMQSKHCIWSIIAVGVMMTSCSNEELPLPELKTNTYSGNSLTVNYCGDEMAAKQIILTPESAGEDGLQHVRLDMSGVLDLSSLGIKDIPPLPAPGVLPGDVSTAIDVTLLPESKEGKYTFSGSGHTQYVDYAYSGVLSSDHLTINLTDVKLIKEDLAGKAFKPVAVNATLADLKNPQDIKTPFYIDWEVGNIPGLELDPGILVNALTLAPIIPVYNNTAYSSLAQVFCQCVQTMALLDNGNIPVRYYSSHEGATQLLTTNPNMLQYVETGENSIQLYINPMSVVGLWLVEQSTPTWLPSFFDTAYAETIKQQIADAKPSNETEADKAIKEALIQSLLLAIKPAMSEGLPLEWTPTQTGINLYLNTETCTDFIGLLLTELLKQPVLAQRLSAWLAEAGLTEQQVEALLQQLPSLLQATTRLNIGLSLEMVSSASGN